MGLPTAFAVPDTPESSDVEREARDVMGDSWLHTENTRLAGMKPVDVLRQSEAAGNSYVTFFGQSDTSARREPRLRLPPTYEIGHRHLVPRFATTLPS